VISPQIEFFNTPLNKEGIEGWLIYKDAVNGLVLKALPEGLNGLVVSEANLLVVSEAKLCNG